MSAEWPRWALELIAAHRQYGPILNAATSSTGVSPMVYDYIVARMKREELDAMLDAEIGL